MTNSTYIVYGLTDPRTGLVRYVGQSRRGLSRARQHGAPSQLAKAKDHKGNWIRQLKSLGLEYGITVLENLTDKSLLDAAEVRWIAHGRASGWDLTNTYSGGDGSGERDAAAKKRMSVAAQGRPPMPQEMRDHLSRKLKGKKRSPEAIARQKLRPPPSAEHRAKIAKSNTGKKHSPEAREKMRLAKLGKKQNPEVVKARQAKILATRAANGFRYVKKVVNRAWFKPKVKPVS